MSAATRNACQHPVMRSGGPELCGEPSVWMTDDLRDVHFLCAEHAADAMRADDPPAAVMP